MRFDLHTPEGIVISVNEKTLNARLRAVRGDFDSRTQKRMAIVQQELTVLQETTLTLLPETTLVYLVAESKANK